MIIVEKFDYKETTVTKEEEILCAIFEGPVRPLTREDQIEQDERELRYQEKIQARNEEYARVLGISAEKVAELRKENVIALIERVAEKKVRDPDGRRARQLRALLGPR